MASTIGGRLRELIKKHEKVAFGIHFSALGASVIALFVATRNNVGVESILGKFPIMGTRNPSPYDDDDVQDKKDTTRD